MKKVIAIPTEPCKKAGAKILHFKSVTSCAAFFGTDKAYVTFSLKKPARKPYCGYYFDYDNDDD